MTREEFAKDFVQKYVFSFESEEFGILKKRCLEYEEYGTYLILEKVLEVYKHLNQQVPTMEFESIRQYLFENDAYLGICRMFNNRFKHMSKGYFDIRCRKVLSTLCYEEIKKRKLYAPYIFQTPCDIFEEEKSNDYTIHRLTQSMDKRICFLESLIGKLKPIRDLVELKIDLLYMSYLISAKGSRRCQIEKQCSVLNLSAFLYKDTDEKLIHLFLNKEYFFL